MCLKYKFEEEMTKIIAENKYLIADSRVFQVTSYKLKQQQQKELEPDLIFFSFS